MEEYGLIGAKLAHSMSPFIHEALFKLSNRDASYKLYEVSSVKEFLKLHPDMDGYSVTIPHKEEGFRLATSLHESAMPYGAINCVDASGVGYNTDVDGFRMSVLGVIKDFNVKVLLLGFGGVGKMIAKQFEPNRLTIAVRNTSDENIMDIHSRIGNKVRVVSFDDIPSEEYDLVVNSTPVGMYPNSDECVISEDIISKCKVVYDTVYNPLDTKLIKIGKSCGVTVKGGIDMLVYQAVVAHKYWYDAQFNAVDIIQIINDVKDVLRQEEWL